ncbi:MAG: hypothetical protein F6K17_26110 [Okeania sp. SIO3C4]|nr:hypothetical protein [Okeania sp. SIO3B3]NER05818.1 hypothetical protein [Okeania sp. SIO3C4]
MNSYTLEEVRQRELEAGGRRKEKVLTGKGFFITLLSGHDIISPLHRYFFTE